MAVEDSDGSGGEERIHRGGLLGVGADGEEALPVRVFGGRAGAVVVEARGGDVEGFDDGGGDDARVVHGGGGGDDGDSFDGIAGDGASRGRGGGEIDGEELVDGKALRSEDAVEAFERKGSLAVEEVGDVCLLEAGLVSEAAAGEGAAFDAAVEFETEEFVKVLKVHRFDRFGVSHSIQQDED